MTENSYKYTGEGFSAFAEAAGVDVEEVWSDAAGWASPYCRGRRERKRDCAAMVSRIETRGP